MAGEGAAESPSGRTFDRSANKYRTVCHINRKYRITRHPLRIHCRGLADSNRLTVIIPNPYLKFVAMLSGCNFGIIKFYIEAHVWNVKCSYSY